MYGDSGTANAEMPGREVPVGIHPQLSDLAKRISASISQVEKMLDRVRGSQPTEALGGNKVERDPSTQEWVSGCHKAMQRLENRLGELQSVIS